MKWKQSSQRILKCFGTPIPHPKVDCWHEIIKSWRRQGSDDVIDRYWPSYAHFLLFSVLFIQACNDNNCKWKQKFSTVFSRKLWKLCAFCNIITQNHRGRRTHNQGEQKLLSFSFCFFYLHIIVWNNFKYSSFNTISSHCLR